jgi:hypothetical protein
MLLQKKELEDYSKAGCELFVFFTVDGVFWSTLGGIG